MSMETFLPIQSVLEWIGFFALMISAGYLVAGIWGWKGPHRTRRFGRFGMFLAVVALCIGSHVALLQLFVLPSLGRDADLERQTRIDEISLVGVGDTAPTFSVMSVDGDHFELSKQLGKVTVINFFDSDCGNCQREFPRLQAIWKQHANNPRFAMIALGRHETGDALEQLRLENGLSFPLAADPSGEVFSTYAREGVPRTYVVSETGEISTFILGYYEDELTKLQAELLERMSAEQ